MDTEFTQADELQLQRLQQGQASARKAVHQGEIDANDEAGLQQQLMQQIQPLSQKKQAKEQQAKQKQYQDMMEQAAQMATIEQENLKLKAERFPEAIAAWQHPITSKMHYWAPVGPGQWEKIEDEQKELSNGELLS